ncbi:steroid 17-alpha-hydroxylase/17,20 lyase isoform X3 [Heliangelus exortis]|uniref:steroid 17-alpha-hydroxylase/17,20 lyase isoform X3 n=1 Tax=Heliangelus exortis TaxID=472823 RepID=UPI003A9024FE
MLLLLLLLGCLLLGLALLCTWGLAQRRAAMGTGTVLGRPRSLPALPLVGSLLHLAGHPQLHLRLWRLQGRYGSLYGLWMGSHYVVVVNSYQHAREVLLKKGKDFAGRPRTVTTDLLSRGGKDIAFASYGPLWKFQRKLVHAALSMFGEGSLALEKIICQEAASLCETLSTVQDTALDMAPELTRAVTNVVCSLCFNSSYRRGDPEFEAMLEYSQGIVDTVAKESLVDIFPWLQVQRKIQEEMDQKIGLARHPHLRDRPLLPYLEATISEVLRIRPVSPLLIPHVSLADTSIGEYSIPKGARVIINLWSVHHDEKEWDKPEEFNPRRFLDEKGQHIHSPSPSYLPFGAGIRVCLGEILAKMELFLFLAWMLQRFTLECPQDQPLPSLEGKFGVVLQVQKFQVKARLRDAWRAAS